MTTYGALALADLIGLDTALLLWSLVFKGSKIQNIGPALFSRSMWIRLSRQKNRERLLYLLKLY